MAFILFLMSTTLTKPDSFLSSTPAIRKLRKLTPASENGVQPCDIGSSIDELKAMFPQVDFSQVDPVFPDKSSPEAAFYHETKSAIINRGQTVLRELRERPEKAVIVVSHSGFLRLGCTGHWFMNADWRVFEFEEGEEVKLRQWEETKAGGMGWSWEETVPLGHGLPEP